MSLRVRAMKNADIDRVYAIELIAHRAPWSRNILSDCVFVGYDCRVLEIKNETKVELASYMICRYNDNICHILNLCVAPALQGRGYGQMLLQDVIDSPAQPTVESFLLEVRPSNAAALRLYQKMGFQQVGLKPGYYRDEQGVEDAVLLQKKRGSLSV